MFGVTGFKSFKPWNSSVFWLDVLNRFWTLTLSSRLGLKKTNKQQHQVYKHINLGNFSKVIETLFSHLVEWLSLCFICLSLRIITDEQPKTLIYLNYLFLQHYLPLLNQTAQAFQFIQPKSTTIFMTDAIIPPCIYCYYLYGVYQCHESITRELFGTLQLPSVKSQYFIWSVLSKVVTSVSVFESFLSLFILCRKCHIALISNYFLPKCSIEGKFNRKVFL